MLNVILLHQVAKLHNLLLPKLPNMATRDPFDGHVVDAEHALAQQEAEEAADVSHEAVAVVHDVLLPQCV